MTPATDKQRGMLAYQLRTAFNDLKNEDVRWLDLITKFRELNDAGLLDKPDVSDLIANLLEFNNNCLDRPEKMMENTEKILRNILKTYETN